MTNWVTIKIPKETRDKAQEDSRTYEEIMKDGLDESPTVEGVDASALVSELEDTMNQLSMANDPTTDIDVEGMMQEIKKVQELAEQARNESQKTREALER